MGIPEKGRDLLPRAIQRLGQESIISLTSRFAALEYRSPQGLPERGHTLFEGILTSFPKRRDVWVQFVDLEITAAAAASGDRADVVRKIFEEGAKARGLKAYGAKKWFKKWADWEENNGDGQGGREAVMDKATEWVRAHGERNNEQDQEQI